MQPKHAYEIQIKVRNIFKVAYPRVSVVARRQKLVPHVLLDEGPHMQQSNRKQDQIEYVRVGFHEIEHKLQILQLWQVVFLL